MDNNGNPGSPTSGTRSVGGSLRLRPRPMADLPSDALQRITELAAEVRADDPRIDDLSPFGAGVCKGIGKGPCAWFGDTAEIPLMAQNPQIRFDYRLGWLAQDRDIVVIGGPHFRAFEDYQRLWLNTPGLRYLNVDPDPVPPRSATPKVCLRDTIAFGKLCGALAGQDTVTLHAHLTTGTIWALAARLNHSTGAEVYVAGPPPLLSRRANNKIWFGHVAQRLLGTGATPPKRAAYSASALTRHVAELARDWDRLVVKVPDSAGSAGNFLVRSEDITGLKPAALYRHLMRDLSVNGRPPVFPILVEVWDANVLTSPSVQTWIPNHGEGPPVIEEVFEQVLQGEHVAFAGAVLANLPPTIEVELTGGALQLASLFQQLGYYGRCSFDALVTGDNDKAGTVHWIECNARWGGVSVPMSLVHRMTQDASDPRYAIVQNDSDTFRALDFTDALLEFADFAPPPDLRSGILFLSPNLMDSGTGCHFLAFGPDMNAAAELARSAVQRLKGPWKSTPRVIALRMPPPA